MKDGFKVIVNGEVVAESDDYALRMRVVSERGELAAFGLSDVHELRLEVDYESAFNKHLNQVEREQRENRREAVAKEKAPAVETSSTEEEVATSASSDASNFTFGDNDETSESVNTDEDE